MCPRCCGFGVWFCNRVKTIFQVLHLATSVFAPGYIKIFAWLHFSAKSALSLVIRVFKILY